MHLSTCCTRPSIKERDLLHKVSCYVPVHTQYTQYSTVQYVPRYLHTYLPYRSSEPSRPSSFHASRHRSCQVVRSTSPAKLKTRTRCPTRAFSLLPDDNFDPLYPPRPKAASYPKRGGRQKPNSSVRYESGFQEIMSSWSAIPSFDRLFPSSENANTVQYSCDLRHGVTADESSRIPYQH